MAVYAPDSSKSMEMYETCISNVVRILREGRFGGAKDFYITGDLRVHLQRCQRRGTSQGTGRRTHKKLSKWKEKEEVDRMETKKWRATDRIQEEGDGESR